MNPLLLNRLLLASLIWVVVSFLIHELSSLDIWWQMTIGEEILQQLRVPETNIYSFGALDRPYHDSHWLFQVVLGLFHRLAGLNGPILFMALVWGITLFFLYRELRSTAGPLIAALMTFLAMGASAERFLPRPEIVTFLMIVLFYSRLRQGKFETPGQIGLLLLLQVIWVNSHGLFVIGPFMVGCHWLLQGIALLRKQENRFRPLSLLLALICLSLVVSPYGTGALEYSYLLFHEVGEAAPEHMKGVNELSPTFGPAAMGASAFWFFAALFLLAVGSAAATIKRLNVASLLIVSALALAAATGRRNIVLFALAAAPFAGENLAILGSRFTPGATTEKLLKGSLAAVMLLWSLYPLSGRYYLDMEIPARFGLGVTPDFFPHGLKPFMDRHGIRGRVYNTDRLGGFYMYHFFPESLPFRDGRWEIYGDAFFQEKRQAQQSYDTWKRWVAGYGIDMALLHHTAPESGMLVPALYRDPEWSLVYYDFAASLFVRKQALGSATPIRLTDTSPLPDGDVRPDARFMLNAFYRNLGQKELLLKNLALLLPSGRERTHILLEMARTHMDLNRLDEAERHYLQLLESDPNQVDALSDLSFIKYQRRQYPQALDYSARAMETQPDNADLRFNHAMVLTALGRNKETIEQLNAILKSHPDYWKARQLLMQLSTAPR